MLRSTALYSAGLSVWTVAAIGAWELVGLVVHWNYKDGRSYAAYLLTDVTAVLYILVAGLVFWLGALAFTMTRPVTRPAARVAMLAIFMTVGLPLAAAVAVTLGFFLQARGNGALLGASILLPIFGTALSIAAFKFVVPAALAAALWSWFFCVR